MDLIKFLGLTEDSARTLAAQAGLKVRVLTNDVPTLLVNDRQLDRLTLVVVAGIIRNAYLG